MISEKGAFRFAEDFHQPIAWSRNFTIVDLETPLQPEKYGPSGFKGITPVSANGKVSDSEALDVYLTDKNEQRSHIYHPQFGRNKVGRQRR
jgi:hypothetical protein